MIRIAVRTAAGDLEATWDTVRSRERRFSEAPYDTTGLDNPLAARVAGLDRSRPAEILLLDVLDELVGDRDRSRMGLVVGTSSGNIAGVFEEWHRGLIEDGHLSPVDRPGRDGPTVAAQERFGFGGPVTTLSLACVSGTAAFLVAEAWLADGLCDEVVVAGVDALSQYVHAGFSGLGALSKGLPRPFTEHHDGMLLGEAAAAVLLGTGGDLHLVGTGMASDARHATAPDREARGAIRAALGALMASPFGPDDIHTLSPHGTGTVFNDAMEGVVLRTLFPEPRPLQLVKRAIGHTLGAAGTVEAAVALRTLQDEPGAVLSMSSAFGGMNASVVFGTSPASPRSARPTQRHNARSHTAELREAWPDAPVSLLRHDRYIRRGVAALLAEHRDHPFGDQTALVLTSTFNCGMIDHVYHARIVEEGPARASRRAFADTLPAAPITTASLLFGARGPLLAFIDGPERGVEEAERLVRYGHAEEAIAVHLEVLDDRSPVTVQTVRVTA